MQKLLIMVIALGLGATVLATPADAQPRTKEEKREKAKQRIRIMRALILSEELQLDEATAGKLAPILNRFDDEIAKLLLERAALRAELRTAADASDARRMDRTIDKLVANQDARWDTERRRFADLRKLLTPQQTARLLDVLPEIDRRIMKGLRQHIAPQRLDRPMRRKGRLRTQLPDDAPDNPF
ncbi:MAG TPA: hypothetical protein VM261_11170 [Kofleriaceae bacterium]|nr:hypothetical protein [Kofleriaceae bacterium]